MPISNDCPFSKHSLKSYSRPIASLHNWTIRLLIPSKLAAFNLRVSLIRQLAQSWNNWLPALFNYLREYRERKVIYFGKINKNCWYIHVLSSPNLQWIHGLIQCWNIWLIIWILQMNRLLSSYRFFIYFMYTWDLVTLLTYYF